MTAFTYQLFEATNNSSPKICFFADHKITVKIIRIGSNTKLSIGSHANIIESNG